jgi:hypothetical protein
MASLTVGSQLKHEDNLPQKLWIFHGLFWFVFAAYCWTAWILGPDFKENAIGRDLASWNYTAWIRTVEVISIILAIVQLWIFVIRPKLKTGSLSFDGMFFLACWTLYFQEPWLNYNSPQFLYTTVSYNMGSWLNYIPGWNSPNAELIPVGSIIWFTAYLSLVALWAYLGSRFMNWYKTRRPEASVLRILIVTFCLFIPFDIVLEHIILMTELFNYASTVPELTLWSGEKYQLPIYEIVSWCACLTAWSAVHYFRDDQGYSFPERGFQKIKFPNESIKTFCRFLAIMGFCQLMFLALYNIPYFYWSTKGGSYPDYAPYKIGGLCGPETDYDCPGLEVPLSKAASPTNRIIDIK